MSDEYCSRQERFMDVHEDAWSQFIKTGLIEPPPIFVKGSTSWEGRVLNVGLQYIFLISCFPGNQVELNDSTLGDPRDRPFLSMLNPVLLFILLQFAGAHQLFASSWECQFMVGNCLGVKLEVIYKPRILTVSKPLYINKICSAVKKKKSICNLRSCYYFTTRETPIL